ncbi:hypothetical protein ACA758_02340 [Mycoplasmopsis agassizii]|uniref:hypothetical protein n=1 Tax=Mycoplasmopsis agassizii TaxID=33922 RepID=UPI0035288DE9
MKKRTLIIGSALASAALVAGAGVVAGVVISKQQGPLITNPVQNLLLAKFKNIHDKGGTLVINKDEAISTGVLTSEEMIELVTKTISTTIFAKGQTEADFAQVVTSLESTTQAATKLNIIKALSNSFTTFIDGFPSLEISISSVSFSDEVLKASAKLTVAKADGTSLERDVVIRISSTKTTDETTAILNPNPGGENPANPSTPETLGLDESVNDRALIKEITDALNGKTFSSKDKTVKTGVVFANFLLAGDDNDKKLALLKQYVDLPESFTANLVLSMVLAQPAQYSSTLTVEIILKRNSQLGVLAFSINDFFNTEKEFTDYWQTYTETLKTNAMNVTGKRTAKGFYDLIKDMTFANQLYALAKVVNADDTNTLAAFAELVTPLPSKFAAITKNEITLVDAETTTSAGSLLVTTSVTFNSRTYTATNEIKGFVSANEQADAEPGLPNLGEKTEEELAKEDQATLKDILTKMPSISLKSDIGIVAFISKLNAIKNSDKSENDKQAEYLKLLADSSGNSELSALLAKAKATKLTFTTDINATDANKILSLGLDVHFSDDTKINVTANNLNILGVKRFEDFNDEANPIDIALPGIELRNFIEVERNVSLAGPPLLQNDRSLLANMERTDLGAYLYNLPWTGIKLSPPTDKTVNDKLKVVLQIKVREKNAQGVEEDVWKLGYFNLKFTNPLEYKNVSIENFTRAVEANFFFHLMTRSGWIKSKWMSLALKYNQHENERMYLGKQDIWAPLWLLETPASERTLGKDGVYKLLMHPEYNRLYLFAADGPSDFFSKAGFGAEIVMFDNDGKAVPYVRAENTIYYLHYDHLAYTLQYEFYNYDLYHYGVIYD